MAHDPSPSQLTAHLGYWLRYVSNHVSHAFARKLEGEDVTVAEWAVLRTLYGEAPVAPSQLAGQMGLTRGAISKLADRLIAKNLIVRQDSPEDGRAHRLRLSSRGEALVPKLSALADENDREFFDHLTTEERTTVDSVLKAVVERRGLTSIPVV
jgi:DNA-binding MarR family transcriptional regulator